jgi:hypothetical protein
VKQDALHRCFSWRFTVAVMAYVKNVRNGRWVEFSDFSVKKHKFKTSETKYTPKIWVRLSVITLHISQVTGLNLNLILIKIDITSKFRRAFARFLERSIKISHLKKRKVKFLK